MNGKDEKLSGIRVFAYQGDELREIIRAHVASAQACIDELRAQMPEDKPITDEMAAGSGFASSREVFEAAIRSCEVVRDEADWMAAHVAEGEHRMTAAEVLAFRKAFGPLKIDWEKLKFAPMAATAADAQAERIGPPSCQNRSGARRSGAG